MEQVLDLLSHPQRALHRLKQKTSPGKSFLAYALGCAAFLMGIWVTAGRQAGLLECAGVLVLAGTVFALLVMIQASWLHFFALLLGGQGRWGTLLTLLGFCFLPLHLFLPVALIFRALGLSWPLAPCAAVLLAWSALLGLEAARLNYRLSRRKAILVGLAPFLTLAGGIVLLLTLGLVVAGFVAYFTRSSWPHA